MSGDNGKSEAKYDGSDPGAVERFIAAMENMLKSEGWKYFEASLRSAESLFVDQMANCANPSDMIRLGGKLSEVRAARNWPGTMLRQAVADLPKAREHAAKKAKEAPHGK